MLEERRVYHHKYGLGKIIGERYKGLELQVEFENGKRRWIKADELIFLPVSHPSPTTLSNMSSQHQSTKFRYRRMIEAFRLGIVPYDCVDDFTFGRDTEISQIRKWLLSPEGALFVTGEYGSGKTHLMHYIISLALRIGFAVSWVELDPQETPFHKPKRIYRHLVKNFRYQTQEGRINRFRDFVKEVVDRGGFTDNIYFSYVKKFERNSPHLQDKIWNWIEAAEAKEVKPLPAGYWEDFHFQNFPGLYDYSTAANVYCYLLSSLGWAAHSILGLRGLLLVFDEAEIVDMGNTSYQDSKGKNFLKALIRVSENDLRLTLNPRFSKLDYCHMGKGYEPPFIYKIPTSLKVLFAFSSMEWNYNINRVIIEVVDNKGETIERTPDKEPKDEELDSVRRIDIKPLTEDAQKDIIDTLCLIYDQAYDFLRDPNILARRIFDHNGKKEHRTRLFVKSVVEALDLLRFYPDQET